MAAPVIALDGSWGSRLTPQSFRIRKGDSRDLVVLLRDRNGETVLLDGTFVWRLANGDHPDFSTRLNKSGTVTAGLMTIPLSSQDMNLTPDRYYHDLEVTETSSGAVSTALSGHITVREDLGNG